MSFADQVTDMTAALFDELGESAVYTSPSSPASSVSLRAMLDEPNEAPFPRELSRSAFRERITSVWLPRVDADGSPFTPEKDGTVVITTGQGLVRTLTLVSQQHQDPDRTQWKVREAGA